MDHLIEYSIHLFYKTFFHPSQNVHHEIQKNIKVAIDIKRKIIEWETETIASVMRLTQNQNESIKLKSMVPFSKNIILLYSPQNNFLRLPYGNVVSQFTDLTTMSVKERDTTYSRN